MAKQLAADALAKLRTDNKMSDQACAELKTAQESASQAQVELEQVRAELKKSWELESSAQTQVKKAQEELEGTFLILTYPFALLFSPGDLGSLYSTPKGYPEAVRFLRVGDQAPEGGERRLGQGG